MKICIVIPTYNEYENLLMIVPEIEDVLSTNLLEGYIVMVDDSSPDGTGELAEKLAKEYGNIIVIHRQGKLGLGSAYREAFQMVMKDLDVDAVFEMDADLSHNPAYIPNFIKELDEGYDVIVGSRYMDGGGIDSWSFKRRAISKGANFLARKLTGINISDVTSGFRAYSVRALRRVNLDDIKSSGYAFQVEFLYECAKAGLRIAEYPIGFKDRHDGKSKLGNGAIFEFTKALFDIAFTRVRGVLEKEIQRRTKEQPRVS